jgi:hypothetical protein
VVKENMKCYYPLDESSKVEMELILFKIEDEKRHGSLNIFEQNKLPTESVP